jgi:hypothetical protein
MAATQNNMALSINPACSRANGGSMRPIAGKIAPDAHHQVSGVQLPSALRQAVPRAILD